MLCHDLDKLRAGIAIAGLDHSTIQRTACVISAPGRAWAAITYVDPTTNARTKGLMVGFGFGPNNTSQGWRFQDLKYNCTENKNDVPAAVYQAACT